MDKNRFNFITYIIIFIVYNIIGYVFDVNVLKIVTIHENGFDISFVALFVPIIPTYLIYYVARLLNETSK